jgi:hypothetical protein
MSQSAYIKFVEGSAVSALSLDELKEKLLYYKEQLHRTGQQLDWEYGQMAFPYSIEQKPDAEGKWFYLKGIDRQYKYILFGVSVPAEGSDEKGYIQVTLPDDCTHGDKAKGNEFCKFLGKAYKAELHLFNGRVLYYNPRK